MTTPTQLRGQTQIQDFTLSLSKFTQYVQNLFNKAGWTRTDITNITNGQVVVPVLGLVTSDETEVRRNGLLLHPSEYTVNNDAITLVDPLAGDEVMTVFRGVKLSPGVYTPLDAGGANV